MEVGCQQGTDVNEKITSIKLASPMAIIRWDQESEIKECDQMARRINATGKGQRGKISGSQRYASAIFTQTHPSQRTPTHTLTRNQNSRFDAKRR